MSNIRMGDIVGRNSDGTYSVRLAGSEHPISRVPPLHGQRHAIGENVPIDMTDPQAPQLLVAYGRQRLIRPWKNLSVWSTTAGNGERQRCNPYSTPPASLTGDSVWNDNEWATNGRTLFASNKYIWTQDLRIDVETSAAVGVFGTVIYADDGGIFTLDAGTLQRRTLANEVLWEAQSGYDGLAGRLLCAVSSTSSAIVIGAQGTPMYAHSTGDGQMLWHKPWSEILEPDASQPTEDCWMGYSAAEDAILIRYVVPGPEYSMPSTPWDGGTSSDGVLYGIIGTTWLSDDYAPGPFSEYRFGRQLRIRVVAVSAADGSIKWRHTLPIYGLAETPAGLPVIDGTIARIGRTQAIEPLTRGAVVRPDGKLAFCAVTVDQVELREYRQWAYPPPGPQVVDIAVRFRKVVSLCNVGASGAEVVELGSVVCWQNLEQTDYLQQWRVAGYDVPNGRIVLYADSIGAATVDVSWLDPAPSTAISPTISAVPLTVAAADDEGQIVWTRTFPSTPPAATNAHRITRCAIGSADPISGASAVLGVVTADGARLLRLDTSDGSTAGDVEDHLVNPASANGDVATLSHRPVILHRGRAYVAADILRRY